MDRTVRLDAMFVFVLAAVGVVDLQRGVFELVLVVEHGLDVGACGMAIHVAGDQDVRRQRRLTRGDLPDVQVVDFDNSGDRGQPWADHGRVGVGRGGLEEDPSGLADQAPAGL